MNIPFTQTEFKQVFSIYNEAIWPIQIIAYILAVIVIILILKRTKTSNMIICMILSAYWVLAGVGYHIMFFNAINPAAYAFGALFIIQGQLFLLLGMSTEMLQFGYEKGIALCAGLVLVTYSMIIYPLFGILFGHAYPEAPVFGVAPCPITIFTFGILLLTIRRIPRYLLIIPVIWSLIGFTAAFKLGIYQDFGLPVSAFIAVLLILKKIQFTLDEQ